MPSTTIGLLHPGAMGVSIGASAAQNGHTVLWASEGRSPATRERAESRDFTDAGSLADLCRRAHTILSVCPPHAAESQAEAVVEAGFAGIYCDANAVSPMRSESIAAKCAAAGIAYVDGGIIGGPAWKPGSTWLYLSGGRAEAVAALFADGPLETGVIGDDPGRASALKMCFAAHTKGTTALLTGIVALAGQLGVRDALFGHWERSGSDLHERAPHAARTVTAKAWRFAGEMDEIADTFEAAGLPDGFHRAAARIYEDLAGFKDAPATPELEAVLDALLQRPRDTSRHP